MLVILLIIVSIIAITFTILYFTYKSGCDNAVKKLNNLAALASKQVNAQLKAKERLQVELDKCKENKSN